MNKKILIIDDSRTARMFIKQCFEIAGFTDCEFLEANDGGEALQVMRNEPSLALVITDINMPIKDGISMLREMRANAELEKVPVLVISSTQNSVRESEMASLNVLGIIAKPLNLPQVADMLDQIKKRLGM